MKPSRTQLTYCGISISTLVLLEPLGQGDSVECGSPKRYSPTTQCGPKIFRPDAFADMLFSVAGGNGKFSSACRAPHLSCGEEYMIQYGSNADKTEWRHVY
ncbi:unnamed protein product [Chondrus crispus]|uniref:Uncharacterized protein n=1 Tax=Chondrus crispus TaxID=2769 RepID=R7Q5K3_CHOCR|nr:unnamed protein product [Chondrus crispus]CDF33299.1 unnamed protein product [Chondrus crispus]|eukprot:XP_005713102.1 unnamed protein product [Chondrus crispus]